MQCRSCGAEAAAGAVFCSQCGKKLADDDSADPASQAGGLFAASNDAAANLPCNVDGDAAAKKDDDRVLWQGTYSPKAMLGGWILCGLFSIALLFVGGIWVRTFGHWLLLIESIALVWIVFSVVWSYRRVSVRYRLTPVEFVHERGILQRVNNRIETIDMADIAFSQTLLQRLVGVGDIRILSSDRSDPDLVLSGIADVAAVTEIFNNARREERRRRGVHVEQI